MCGAAMWRVASQPSALAPVAWAALAILWVEAKSAEATYGVDSSGCTQHGRGQYHWPQEKGDVNRTGCSPHVVVSNLSVEPTWVWKDPYSDVIHCSLIDDRGSVYLGTRSGRMYKFGPGGGMLWYYRSPRGNTPAIASLMDGQVFMNTVNGFVLSLDMETGKELWATQVSESTQWDTASILAVDGTVISATRQPGHWGNNNLVVALDARGSFRWSFPHFWSTWYFQASAPGDGTLLFQDQAGGVYRIQLEDGRLLWESGVQDRENAFISTGSTMVGPNGVVYCASNYAGEGIIHAYRLSDGSPLWRRSLGLHANQGVSFGVLAGSLRPSVVAGLGENPGMPFVYQVRGFLPDNWAMWFHRTSIRTAGRPFWLFHTKEMPGALVALDAETGETRWWYTPPPFTRPAAEGDEAMLKSRWENIARFPEYPIDEVCYPPSWAHVTISGDGTTYAGFEDGNLYTVRDIDGNGKIDQDEVSTRYFANAFQASHAIAPGMLAVAPCGGGLYVWKS